VEKKKAWRADSRLPSEKHLILPSNLNNRIYRVDYPQSIRSRHISSYLTW
jgi:hypothetical protein